MNKYRIDYTVTYFNSSESVFKNSLSHPARDKSIQDFAFREAESAEQAVELFMAYRNKDKSREFAINKVSVA